MRLDEDLLVRSRCQPCLSFRQVLARHLDVIRFKLCALRGLFSLRNFAVGTLSLNWRYIGATNLTSNSSDPNLAGTPSAFNSRIKAYNYFDLAGTAKVQDGIVFRAGVNNVFDKDPPIIAQGLLTSFGNGNTYPGLYDAVGRTVFIGLTAEF